MSYLAIKAFFEGICTEEGWGFAHNTEQLSDEIQTNKHWTDKMILTMDEPRGSMKYLNMRYQDDPAFGFWLHRPVKKNDWELEDIYYSEAKTAFIDKILAPMVEQMEDQAGIWRYLDERIDYRKSGPMGTERLFGIYVNVNTK